VRAPIQAGAATGLSATDACLGTAIVDSSNRTERDRVPALAAELVRAPYSALPALSGAQRTQASQPKQIGYFARGARLGLSSVHPHMLRHACGFILANDAHDTRALQHCLGHKNIQHTVCSTEVSPSRFRDFWKD
jgi:site-specific recombinase XerD